MGVGPPGVGDGVGVGGTMGVGVVMATSVSGDKLSRYAASADTSFSVRARVGSL